MKTDLSISIIQTCITKELFPTIYLKHYVLHFSSTFNLYYGLHCKDYLVHNVTTFDLGIYLIDFVTLLCIFLNTNILEFQQFIIVLKWNGMFLEGCYIGTIYVRSI